MKVINKVLKNRVSNFLAVVSLLLVYLLLAGQAVAAQSLTASLDRHAVSISDTVTLQLKATEISILSEPDFSTLETDFNVLGKSVSHSIRHNNGVTSKSTVWTIQLQPKNIGSIVLPIFSLSGLTSQEIILSVSKEELTANDSADFQLQLLANKSTAKVNEQIIVTLRFSYAKNVSNLQNSELSIANAKVIKLEDKGYETRKNGKNYGVYEISYAVFAASVGELKVPLQQIKVRLGRNSIFSNSAGKTISMQSEPLNIKITQLEESAVGILVAESLQIEEHWSNSASEINLGESITRQISMQVIGARAQSIPPIKMEEIAGVKIYPETALKSEQKTERGLVTNRSRGFAIVPTITGELLIPKITYKWWNSTTGEYQTTILAARKVKVLETENAGSHTINVTVPSADIVQKAAIQQAQDEQNNIEPQVRLEKVFVEHPFNQWLLILNIGLVLVIIVLAVLLLRASRRMALNQSYSVELQCSDRTIDEEKLFSRLQGALKSGSDQEIYQGLTAWVKNAAVKDWQCSKLESNIRVLEQQLYAENKVSQQWDKKEFVLEIKLLRKKLLIADKKKNTVNKQPIIADLYPDNQRRFL